jgi:flagellar basal body-associated protein FliL
MKQGGIKMEQTKQSLIKILLIVNLAISTCAAIGVGYIAYKQSTSPNISEMGPRGGGQMAPGQNQFEPGQDQSGKTQSDQTQ